MTVFLSVAVDADDVLSGMNDDAEFLQEMLFGIADGLNKGLLLDNAPDVFRGMNDDKQDFIAEQLGLFVDLMKSEIENRD